MQRDLDSVLDIVQACRRLQRHIQGVGCHNFSGRRKNSGRGDSADRNHRRGRQATQPPFRQANPNLPWKEMASMRDILIHQYDRVDVAEVWNAAVVDLPAVLSALEPLVPPEQSP
jgi:hypothetical protein